MTGRKTKQPKRWARFIPWVLTTLALVLLAGAWWINFRFGSVILEEILLNMPVTGGEGAGNDTLVIEATLICIGVPLALVATFALVKRWMARRRARLNDGTSTNDRPVRGLRLPMYGAIAAFTVSLAVLLSVAGVPQYAMATLEDRSFADYYVTPSATTSTTTKPRNLITIYMESMENTFSDTEIFGQNLLAPLDAATQGWSTYDSLRQYPGGGWTMAGVVSTQCGIPLKSKLLIDGVNPNSFGEHVSEFLPGATCIGDVLSDNGYKSVFLGGADSSFAGKGTYLEDHGYSEHLGREVWEDQGEPKSNISVWGLSDKRLMDHAKETVTKLDASSQPFNLTLLTLDTHEPGGTFNTCKTDDKEKMATAIKCSMTAVADFLNYLKTTGVMDDTVVMVMGDHLKATSEGGAYKSELDGADNRSIVFRVASPDPVTFTRQDADQLSVLPTTLELLGLKVPDGRAGLGVSFVGKHSLDGTALALSHDEYVATVTAPSNKLYKEFWGD